MSIWLITVIELCEVQFGLKLYAWFESQVRFQDFFSLYKCFLDPEMSWFVESCKRDFFLFSNNFIGFFEQLVVVF